MSFDFLASFTSCSLSNFEHLAPLESENMMRIQVDPSLFAEDLFTVASAMPASYKATSMKLRLEHTAPMREHRRSMREVPRFETELLTCSEELSAEYSSTHTTQLSGEL